jgi:hypothetical protein
MTSCDVKAPSCPGTGSYSFGGNGQYTLVIFGKDRPKLTVAATANRTTASAEEYKGIGQGTVAQFGTWSVDEANKTLTRHPDSTFTRANEGTDAKVSISLTGDELKLTGSGGGSTTWKKAPSLQQVAQVAAAPAAAQQRTLKQQIQGPWSLVSCNNTIEKGEKQAFCTNPRGVLILAGNGNYALTTIAASRKEANAPGVASNFGTWSVNEADKTLTRHFVGANDPANEGKDIKLNISLNGEEMRLTGEFRGHIDGTYRRFK